MRWHHATLAVLVLAGTANAHLGWTSLECIQNYGAPTAVKINKKEFKDSSIEQDFSFDGFTIRVVWFPGSAQAQSVIYSVKAGTMTREQFASILTANAQGFLWSAHIPGIEGGKGGNRSNGRNVDVASALSGSAWRYAYFYREDGARTNTLFLPSINRVAIRSAWLVQKEKREADAAAAAKARVPNL